MKLKWIGLLLGLAVLPKAYSAEAEAIVTDNTPTTKSASTASTETALTESALTESASTESALTESASTVTVSYDDPNDPFEGFNRAMWDFNYLYLDRYILRPVAHAYNDYLPIPAKSGLNNLVQNLEEPSSLVNNLLQGKWGWAANAGGRFTVNSTIGLLGIIDVADMMGMPRKQDAFNEVLGYYGVPNGPYFMAPFAGPYVVRELATDWVDGLYFPLSEFTLWQTVLRWSVKSLHARASAIDQERLIDNALDPYAFVKYAYLQHMDYKVYDGDVPQTQEDDELLEDFMLELE